MDDPKSTGVLFVSEILHQMRESVLAISPIFAIVLIAQPLFLKMRRRSFSRLVADLVSLIVGLVLFFTGVNAGFMEVGREIGSRLAMRDGKLACWSVSDSSWPTDHSGRNRPCTSLTRQIEEVTSGSVRQAGGFCRSVSRCGHRGRVVGIAHLASPGLQLWHILLPGYAIALVLAHLGSKLFVGMAFDAGGVASGPMTARLCGICARRRGRGPQANVLIADSVSSRCRADTNILYRYSGSCTGRKTGIKGGDTFAGQ
jgi:hypothetical protein